MSCYSRSQLARRLVGQEKEVEGTGKGSEGVEGSS